MPQIPSNTVGSIRQTKEGKFELLAPTGANVFTGATPEDAQEFAQGISLPVREGVTPFTAPPAAPGTSPGASGGQTGTGTPSGGSGAPEGVSPITAGRAQLPGPNEFTNLLKKVVDVKLGRKPFIIGISDEDMKLLTPSAVRQELGNRTNKLLAEGADVSAIMGAYQGMYKDTLDVADKYLRDMENRQKILRELVFGEAVLTNGVLPEQFKGILSPEEQAIWGEMSKFYKTEFDQKKSVPELLAKDIDETTGATTLVFRNPFTGEITRKTLEGTHTPDRQIVLDMIGSYPDAGILPTDTLQVAQGKLGKSRIYQDKVRAPRGTVTPSSTFKFDATGRNELIGADFSLSDIQGIEENIKAGNSIDDIIAAYPSMSETQKTNLRSVFTGEKPTAELSDDILNNFLTKFEDEDGDIDFSLVKTEEDRKIIRQAVERGLIDLTPPDEETGGFIRDFFEGLRRSPFGIGSR